MSDNLAGAAAWLGGTEIVNDSRTTAYMRNGIKPETLSVNGDCGCGNILVLAGCDSEYTTPAEDNAPWYDSAIPESAEFAGFLSTEFEGMSSTYSRSVTESIADGATLGRSRFGSRQLTWKGFLFGSSCCGVAYGLRWLGKTLQGSKNCGNNCFGDDLELLVCCPSMEAALGYGPNILCNGSFNNDTGFWTSTGSSAINWVNNPTFDSPGAMRTINGATGAITFNTGSTSDPLCVLSVIGSKTYKLSLQVIGAEGSDSEVLGVTFNWFNSLGVALAPTVLSNLGSDNDSDWSLREATVTAPATAVTVRIDFSIGDAFTIAGQAHIVDEVSFNQTNYAPVVDPFRTLKGVSLLEGPLVVSERKMGSTCGGRCGGSTAVEVEFSLVASQPWMYSAPIPVVNCVKVQENSVPLIGSTLVGRLSVAATNIDTTLQSTDFAFLPVVTASSNIFITLDPYAAYGAPEVVRVTGHVANSTSITVARAQQGTTARSHPINANPILNTFWLLQADCSPADCDFGLQELIHKEFPACGGPTLPPTPSYSGCITLDINQWRAVYVTAPRTMWNSLSEVVPVITIETGGLPVIGARLGFFTSADGNPCGDLINTPPTCDLICDSLYFLSIPGNSKFYIDGRTKKMSLVCGTNAVFPGERYTLGPFSWPSFDCYGFCMEFAYNQLTGSDEMCVSLSLVPRTTQ